MELNSFRTLPLQSGLHQAINQMGFTQMTPVQSACIPLLLKGKDLVGQSQTGSGKTAAFVLPILQRTELTLLKPQALILCPTRELCDQVLRECRKFAQALPGFRTVALVGGAEYSPQKQALVKGVHLIVGTPGRTLEHFQVGSIDVSAMKILVLDEADRMLEDGFAQEMTEILDQLPKERQTLMFSATFPESMENLSRKYQKNPERVTIQQEGKAAPAIKQFVYNAENPQKVETLLKILQRHPSGCTLIFCRTKATVTEIGERLADARVSSMVLHGDLEQSERDRATSLFRNGSIRVLVATDIAARGLDIDALELVVNVDLPSKPEIYIHRIGRTGRAGRKGTSVSIATDYEAAKLSEIEAATGVKMIRQSLGTGNGSNLGAVLRESATKTIQISGGRMDKLRPGDILGALTAEPHRLPGPDIGKIEIHDRYSFVAVATPIAEQALAKLRTVKIKGSKFKAYLVE